MPWDDLSCASKGEVTCGDIRCANLLTTSLHQISVAIYALVVEAIDAALARYSSVEILEPSSMDNSRVNALCVRNKIYLTEPYIRI